MLRIAGHANGWTDWAEIFCGHSWVFNISLELFFQIFCSTGNAGPFS